MGAGLALMTALAYLPTNEAGFIWDDPTYLLENPTIRDPLGLVRIFTSPLSSPQYYPLVFAGFWAEYRVWGLEPAGYHRVNVALHALNAILVWRVARRFVSDRAAWLGAAIFALHPVEVESVAWVTERKNVLSGCFYLSSLLAYAKSGRGWYALAFLLFLAALASKTVACSLPAAILVLAWMERGRIGWSDVRPLLPFFAVGLMVAALTSWLERHHVGAIGPEWNFSPIDRVLIAGRAVWFYAGKLAWPAHLSFIYDRWQIDPYAWWPYAYPAAALALVAVLWMARGRIGRRPLACVLLFGGTASCPRLGFFDVYPMRYSFVADHFQYLASLALILPASWAIDRGAGRWPVLGGMAITALLFSLGAATSWRCLAFRDAETLWIDTLTKSPRCWMAHNNLGVILLRRGLLDESGRHFEAALRLNPDHCEAHNNLGNVLVRRGLSDQGRQHFEAALRLDPDHVEAHNNLATVLGKNGQLDEAERHLRRAIELNPEYWRAYLVLGLVRRQQGRDTEAAELFRTTLRLKPDQDEARSQLAAMNLSTRSVYAAPSGRGAGCRRYGQPRPAVSLSQQPLGNLLQLGVERLEVSERLFGVAHAMARIAAIAEHGQVALERLDASRSLKLLVDQEPAFRIGKLLRLGGSEERVVGQQSRQSDPFRPGAGLVQDPEARIVDLSDHRPGNPPDLAVRGQALADGHRHIGLSREQTRIVGQLMSGLVNEREGV